jgi:hypothetical protein
MKDAKAQGDVKGCYLKGYEKEGMIGQDQLVIKNMAIQLASELIDRTVVCEGFVDGSDMPNCSAYHDDTLSPNP